MGCDLAIAPECKRYMTFNLGTVTVDVFYENSKRGSVTGDLIGYSEVNCKVMKENECDTRNFVGTTRLNSLKEIKLQITNDSNNVIPVTLKFWANGFPINIDSAQNVKSENYAVNGFYAVSQYYDRNGSKTPLYTDNEWQEELARRALEPQEPRQ